MDHHFNWENLDQIDNDINSFIPGWMGKGLTEDDFATNKRLFRNEFNVIDKLHKYKKWQKRTEIATHIRKLSGFDFIEIYKEPRKKRFLIECSKSYPESSYGDDNKYFKFFGFFGIINGLLEFSFIGYVNDYFFWLTPRITYGETIPSDNLNFSDKIMINIDQLKEHVKVKFNEMDQLINKIEKIKIN